MAKARILAVDDQRYFRELIAGMLVHEGFDAQTAAGGEEALRILDSSRFDIVLTDLVMPGMDGSELVRRIKGRHPEQEVVVVTGVVDVRTAVEAMKLGATDYLLKPFDSRTLTVTLEAILQNRRLRTEHARLLAENLEFYGERSLYDRALGLFSTLSIEPLATRIVEELCIETRAQGGVLWLAAEESCETLELAAARGLVRLADEPQAIGPDDLPAELRGGARTVLARWGAAADQPTALYAALRRNDRIAGVVRLSDKLEGESFDALDGVCADKFLHFAEVAVGNALRTRALERRTLEDPVTGAYSFDYFQDVVRIEIEKASRFGRSLALLAIELGDLEPLRAAVGDEELPRWMAGAADQLRRRLRATDLLAVEGPTRFLVLLPEVDALGAAVLKRRARWELEQSELFRDLPKPARPRLRAGVAVYPGDGERIELLLRALDERISQADGSPVDALGLERISLAAALQALVRQGAPERPETAQQLMRFMLAEVARRPRERGLLYASPGLALGASLREGLEDLRDLPTRTDLVVVSDGERPTFSLPGINWVSPERAPGLPPCVVHFGEGPAYAFVREDGRDGAPARLFHTNDRSLVEHLAFRLHEELAVPNSLGELEA